MGQIRVSGTLEVGPPIVNESTFPAGAKSTSLALSPPSKTAGSDTGLGTRTFNSPGAFIPLSGVGAGDDVPLADTFYIKFNSPAFIRLTFVQPGAADLVSIIPVQGTFLCEFPPDQPLKLIELKGSGRIESVASGPQ